MSAIAQTQLDIHPLSAPIGGAIGHGLDEILASADLCRSVVMALDRHLMLSLQAPQVVPQVMAQFSALFGVLRESGRPCAGGVKGLRIVANTVDADGHPLPGADTAAHVWHTDYASEQRPLARIVTYTERAASSRPTTEWVNMVKLYESLPQKLKQRIAGRSAVFYPLTNGVHADKQDIEVPLATRQLGESRPMVCCHRTVSGVMSAPYLYLPSRRDSLIAGLSEAESAALLGELWDLVEASPYRYSAAPQSGSCVIMDNRAVVHNRQAWPATEPRTVWAISCEGELPAAVAAH